jgi:hypothetical protein
MEYPAITTDNYFCVNQRVYSSPNVTYIPEEPNISDALSADSRDIKDFCKRRWFSPIYPQAPFGVKLEKHGALFGRLAVKFSRIPTEETESGHCLSGKLRASWRRLEAALYNFSTTLAVASGVHFSSRMQYFHFPKSFGYQKAYSKPEYAQARAARSRDAFIPLAAACSLAVCLHPEDFDTDHPYWSRFMATEHSVFSAWLDAFKDSSACKFSLNIPRPGVFVRCDNLFHFSASRLM